MAIMIPSIPNKFEPESGEDIVFYALKNLPGDPVDEKNVCNKYKNDYYIFHSFKINQVNKETNMDEEHEIDFLIFHPSKGIICVECKSGKGEGGGKALSETTIVNNEVLPREWYHAKIKIDKNGTKGVPPLLVKSDNDPMIEGGPFKQAWNRKQDLIRLIKDIKLHEWGEEKLKYHCKITYAVCFPKISSAEEEYSYRSETCKFKDFLDASEPNEHVIYGEDLLSAETLENKLNIIFDYKLKNKYRGIYIETGNKGSCLHDEDIQNLFDRVLCPYFNIVETVDPNTGETKYIRLNEDQIRVLDLLMTKKEMAVSGMAGTGKTILALHLARKKAMLGENVLFLCRNRLHKEELEKNKINSKIEFRDIEWLTGIRKKKLKKKRIIIIDEAQDFCNGKTFDCIFEISPISKRENEKLLRKRFEERIAENKNSFYIFYDEFQKRNDSKILELAQKIKNHIELEKNCRNTINIAKTLFSPLTDVSSDYCQRRDRGEKVKIDFYGDKEEYCLKLDSILQTYNLCPQNTIILTFKSNHFAEQNQKEKSILLDFPERLVDRDGKPINIINNTTAGTFDYYYKLDEDRRFRFTNWENFQGLEKSNIVFIDFEPDKLFGKNNKYYVKRFYIGLTRAQDKCFILSSIITKSKGFENKDEQEDTEQLFDTYEPDGVSEQDIIASAISEVLREYYDWYDYTKKAFDLCLKDKAFWEDLGIAYENEDKKKIDEVCELYEIDKNLLKECYDAYYWVTIGSFEALCEAIAEEENAHYQLNPKFLEIYNNLRKENTRTAICQALGAESIFKEDVKNKEIYNYLRKMKTKVKKLEIPEEQFENDVWAMRMAWESIGRILNSETIGYGPEDIEKYGLNCEFMKKEYERLTGLKEPFNKKSQINNKISHEFWEKFKLMRNDIDKGFDVRSVFRSDIEKEKLSELDRIDKEVMEHLILLYRKYS